MKNLFALVVVVAFASSLSACANLRDAMGYGKSPPDEFLVLTKSPLVIPPNYALRPPITSAAEDKDKAKAKTPRSAAQAALLGKSQPELGELPDDMSEGERKILEESGASREQDNIRVVIENEMRNVLPYPRELVEALAAPAR